MRQFILDASYMTDKQSAHEYIAKQFSFPEYYGHNLDALHDMLTDIFEPTIIKIEKTELLETQLGDYGNTLLDVFKDSIAENNFLKLEIHKSMSYYLESKDF